MARDRRRAGSVLIAAALAAASCGHGRRPAAGFWFERDALDLRGPIVAALGGPLNDSDVAAIRRLAGAEVERAFAGMQLPLVETPDAFWRVRVQREVEPNFRRALPAAGTSIALGPFGGLGSVDATIIALAAVRYAPGGAGRATLLDAIGRGIGRVAAHEFGHQILGGSAADDRTDPFSYEYGSPDRAAQYYGELRWTTWRELLARKLAAPGARGRTGVTSR